VFDNDSVSNLGGRCTLEFAIPVQGSSQKAKLIIPRIISGQLHTSLGLTVSFVDPAKTATLKFDDPDLDVTWGGSIRSIDLSTGRAAFEIENNGGGGGCVDVHLGNN
jgi:hypothetical protein